MDANTKAKLEAMQKASKRAAAIRETREHFLTMRKGMEMKISKRVRISVAAILWLLCAGMALAETVHVRSTRIESRNELMPGNQRPGGNESGYRDRYCLYGFYPDGGDYRTGRYAFNRY